MGLRFLATRNSQVSTQLLHFIVTAHLVKCNNICVYRHLCHSSFEWANRQCVVWCKKYVRPSRKLCSHSTLRYQEVKKSGLQLARTTSKSGTFPTAWVLSMASMLLCKLPKIQARLFSTTKFFLVLLAVCDAHYHFVMVDMGDAGRHSDGGVLSNSEFGKALDGNSLSLPQSRPLPGTLSPTVPYVIVGDEVFPLKQNIMRLYPGRNLPQPYSVYNYRLSRARRVIENSFGIPAARWRIFRRPMIATPEHVVSYTKAAIVYITTYEALSHLCTLHPDLSI